MSGGFPTYGVRSETCVPGAVISAVELTDGLVAEYNGVGSVVAYVYPFGLEDPYDDESPQERVERLTAELKEAKKALPPRAGGKQ